MAAKKSLLGSLVGPSADDIARARRALLREVVIVGTRFRLPADADPAITRAAEALKNDGLIGFEDGIVAPLPTTTDHDEDTRRVEHVILYWLEARDGVLPLDSARSAMGKVFDSAEIDAGIAYLRKHKLALLRDGALHDNTGAVFRAKKRGPAPTSSVIRAKRNAENERIRDAYDKLMALSSPGWYKHESDERYEANAVRTIREQTHTALTELPGGKALPRDVYYSTMEKRFPDYAHEIIDRLLAARFITIGADNKVRTHAALPEQSHATQVAAAEAERQRKAEADRVAREKAAQEAQEKAEREAAELVAKERLFNLRHYLTEAARRHGGMASAPHAEKSIAELTAAGLLVQEDDMFVYANPVTDRGLAGDDLRNAREVTANHLRVLTDQEPETAATDTATAVSRLLYILVDENGTLITDGDVIDGLADAKAAERRRLEEETKAFAEKLAREAEDKKAAEERDAENARRAIERQAEKVAAEASAVVEAQSAVTGEIIPVSPKKVTPTTTVHVHVPVERLDRLDQGVNAIGKMVRHLYDDLERTGDSLQARMIRDADPDVRTALRTIVAKLGRSGGPHRTLPKTPLSKALSPRPRADGSAPMRSFFDLALELGVASGTLRMTTDLAVELVDYSLLMTEQQFNQRCAAMARRQAGSSKGWLNRKVSA